MLVLTNVMYCVAELAISLTILVLSEYPTIILDVLVNTGPVEVDPALTKICPIVPGPKNSVLSAVVWYGI